MEREDKISARLNAIADALETASKQARLLAAEVEESPTTFDSEALIQASLKATDDRVKAGQASLSVKLK